jgi:transposase
MSADAPADPSDPSGPGVPGDLKDCQRELLEARQQLAHVERVLAETAVLCEDQQTQIERLRAEMELFRRYLFGRKSERFTESPGQGHLFDPEDGEGAAALPADDPDDGQDDPERTPRRRRRGHGWGRLPEHLPREEVRLDVPPEQRACPCCGEVMRLIGEDRSERVDYRPARIVVKVLVRPKYACTHKHGIRQQPPPPAPVPGGRFDFGLVAQVVTSKVADHLPLYRQQDILARSGLELSRSTLCEVMAGAAGLLQPLAELLRQRVLAGSLLGADDTPVRLLDRTLPAGVRTARFWLYRGFEEAPYNVFDFHESRARDGPQEFLRDFRGWVKVDAYGVDGGVYLGSGERILASGCMAHARRKFYDVTSSHPALAAEALAYFSLLYDIEDRARDLSPEDRQALRQREAVPVLERLKTWADEQSLKVLPKLKLGEAIGYLRNQWESLISYVQDGRLPIDNNATERDLRQLCLGRKAWLFLGSPEAGPRAAVLYTIVGSAARHDLDVWAYLRDVMERLARGESDLANLLPDVWAAAHPEAIRTYRGREREAKAAAKRERRQRRRALSHVLASGK